MENTAKNFALQLGSLVALYVSVTSLLTLLFGVITITYPDPAAGFYEYEGAASQIRFSIAMLIVFFPTYIVLTRMVNTIRRSEHGAYLTLTKWLIYLSLFIGGVVILGDLVAIIHSLLNGELTIRFVLKALAVLVIVGAAFAYYILDARGHWQEKERESIIYGAAASIIVIAALVAGFFHIEPPSEVREMRIDNQQISDLQDMQWRIEEYYRLNEMLPETIDQVYVGTEIPLAPEDRAAYRYAVIDESAFELCAEFAQPSSRTDTFRMARPMFEETAGIKNPHNWDHEAGEWCFERTVTPFN